MDEKLKKCHLNKHLISLLGTTKKAKKLEILLTHVNEESSEIIATIQNAVQTKTSCQFIQTFKHTSMQFLCTVSPKICRYRVIGLIITYANITELYSSLQQNIQQVEKLQDILHDYHNAFNQLPYLIWIRNNNMYISYFNNAYYKFIEDRNVENSNDVIELSNECLLLAQESQIQKTRASRTILITHCNTLNVLDISETPLQKQGGTMGFGCNITHSKQLEKELLKTANVYKNFFEATTSAISIYNSHRQLIFYNNAFVSIFDFDQAWLESKPDYAEILECMRAKGKLPEQADFSQFKRNQISLFKNLIETHNEFHYLPDGTALRVAIIPGIRGELMFSYEDITDKLTLEQSYNTAVAVSKTTINNLHEAIAVYGDNGALRLFNPALEKMLGLSKAYMQSMPHISKILETTKEIYQPNDWEQFKTDETLVITNKITDEKHIKLRNNKYISRKTIILPDGSVLVTYHEITATKLLEQSLREKNNMLKELSNLKSNLFANISYELRSPLTSIMGFAEMLMTFQRDSLSPVALQYISSIARSAQELSQIINDMLDFSSMESGIVDLNKKEIKFESIITALQQEIQNSTGQHSKIKVLAQEIEDIAIEADDKLIMRGLVHLIRYAAQLMGKVKTVKFTPIQPAQPVKKDYVTIYIALFNKPTTNLQKHTVIKNIDNDLLTNINLSIVKKFIEWSSGMLELQHATKHSMLFICTLPAVKHKTVKA